MNITFNKLNKELKNMNATINTHKRFYMHTLPETGYLRLPQIIGNKKSTPPIPAIIPIARSTFLAGVKSGLYPKPIKLSPRVTVWKVEDIRAFIEKTGGDS